MSNTANVKTGFLVGNGAAQNISIGFIPDYVKVINLTDGDKVWEGALGKIVPFSSGGTTEIQTGDQIKGATSGATAWVLQIDLYSGTWAGGDAAGFMVVRDVVGTIASENVYVYSDSTSGTNDATVTVDVQLGIDIDTEVASVATASGVYQYAGSSTVGSEAACGFSISSTVAEEAKSLFYIALKSWDN